MNELAPPPEMASTVADEIFVMPASVSQKRFWMLEQMSPGNTALNIPIAFELRGPLETGVLERALQAIVDRHESFRTRFELVDGEPRQIIAPHLALPLQSVADEAPPGPDRTERIRLAMDREARRPIDFLHAPLLRAALLELAPDDHVLMLTIHHIICDGWSTGILVRELAAFYDAFRRDEPVQLPPLAIQYADYVLWQQDWLKTPEFRQQLDYWRGQLEIETPPLDFPTDFVRRGGQSTVAVLETRLLPASVTESLRRVCQEEGVTLFMIFISAYAALLHRYTGQSRILVGTTAANRSRPELEPIVGLFANLLSIPADISGAMTFRELLAEQRDRALGGFANHEAPFELVVQELQQTGPARVLMHTHLLFQRAFMQPVASDDLHIVPLRSVSPGSTFELTFGIVERAAEGIRLQMEYRTSLYRRETITRFLLHFQQMLEAAAAHPETPIDELPLFAENEREEIESRLTAALHASARVERDTVLAELDRQLDANLQRGQESFALVSVPPAVALAAFDEGGRVAPVDLPGRIHLALPGAATAEATPLLGRNVEGGGVQLWGREGDLIRVQGFRFNRRAMEVQLCRHPQVAEAAALGRTVAQVVLRPGAKIDGAGLRDWLKTEISDLLVPATIRVVPEIKRDAAGEPVLGPESATEKSTSAEGPVPLQALIQQQLLEIWERLLKTRDLTIDSNFFECGGNSFLALRMITESEKLTRQTLPLSLLLRGATVRALAQHILEGANEKGADVIPVQTAGARTPLFFLHGDWIGGGFYCNRLARDLAEDQPFYALPPYHMSDERIVTMREMAAAQVAALRTMRPQGPYLIGGYCIAAVVAIEVARLLVAEGETVEHLFLVDPPLWGGVFLAGTWPWIDRLGDRRGWDLEKKIAFFDRTVVAAGRWWRKPAAEKFGAMLHRLGMKAHAPAAASSAGAQADLGGEQILDGLDFSTYYMTYRLHRFTPLAVPATLLFPDCLPVERQAQAPGLTRLDPAQLRLELIPGNHTTCITEHTAELAEKMCAARDR
jgi:thioesterase domain-containing protein